MQNKQPVTVYMIRNESDKEIHIADWPKYNLIWVTIKNK